MAQSLTKEQAIIWRDRIIRSAKAKQDETRKWDLLNEYYKGNYHPRPESYDRISVNYMLANERQMEAVLYGQQPKMFFTPAGFQSEVAARVFEQVVRRERRIMDAAHEERKAIRMALRYGTGVLKHGYSFEVWPAPAIADKMKKAWKDESDDAEMPYGALTEFNDHYKYGHPWVRSIHPNDFFPDPDALTPQECRWMCHRYRRPYLDAKRDKRLSKKGREELEPSGRSKFHGDMDLLEPEWENTPEGQDTAMVSFLEIYDKCTDRIVVISDKGVLLLDEDYPFFGQDGPYEVLQFIERDDSFWGIPWTWTFVPQVRALNQLRTNQYDHIQRYGQMKGFYDKNAIEQHEMDKFVRNPAGSYLGLNPRNKPIDQIIHTIPYIPIASDAYRLTDQYQFDMDQVSGISELSRGSGKSIQTATEASYVQQQGQARLESMRNKLDRMLRNSTRRVVDLLKQFWGPERVVPLVGPDGQSWSAFRIPQDMVQAAFDVDVEPGSTERIDKNVRIRQIIDSMQTLEPFVPYLQQQGYDLNWPEVIKDYLQATDVSRNPARWLVQLPPPQPQAPDMGGGQMSGQPSTAYQLPPATAVNDGQMMPWDEDQGGYARTYSEAQTGDSMVGV